MNGHISNAQHPAVLATTLERGDYKVQLTEHLMSALEGCGINNCIIEIQGGQATELPILDGSALPWLYGIKWAGIVNAKDQSGNLVEQVALKPAESITIWDSDDAFISFIPGDEKRITYGIDFSHKSSIIGQQWYSWSDGASTYEESIAPARTFCCFDDIEKMQTMGLIKGGSEYCAMIAKGEGWLNGSSIRYPMDEQARHKILDILGDLALIASEGNDALPYGHIIAYKAGHDMHLKFAKALVRILK